MLEKNENHEIKLTIKKTLQFHMLPATNNVNEKVNGSAVPISVIVYHCTALKLKEKKLGPEEGLFRKTKMGVDSSSLSNTFHAM